MTKRNKTMIGRYFRFRFFRQKNVIVRKDRPSKSETRKPRGVKAADDDGLKFVDRVCVGVRVCMCECLCICACLLVRER